MPFESKLCFLRYLLFKTTVEFLDEIYATLVVRLHHTKPFTQDQLWRYAADFKTPANNSA